MRYPVSGTATKAIDYQTSTGATGTTTLLSVSTGRVFWLRGIHLMGGATAPGSVVEIYDATAQATATAGVVLQVNMGDATGLGDVTREFPEPGIKFSGGYVLARMHGTASSIPGAVSIWGFEE